MPMKPRKAKPRSRANVPLDIQPSQIKPRRRIPHEFVLEALSALTPRTRPLFSCLAVYVQDKIVLALRDKQDAATSSDNGVWVATTQEHHESLRLELPSMRSIRVLGKEVTGWQVLPADSTDFEEVALRACDLILANDPRIGKSPKSKRVRHPGGRAAGKRTR